MNALIECSACGREVSPEARACPHCGHPTQRAKSSWLLILMAILIFLALVGWQSTH